MKQQTNIKLGLDFDNTIVCYDDAITVLANKILDLPPEVSRTKLGLRDYLRKNNRESEWTAFQGELYGPGMKHARAFEGAIEAMLELSNKGYELVIVSHRSRRPYAGKPHDLHSAALSWIAEHLQSKGLFVDENASVNFLETFQEKLERIGKLGCQIFLDDLPQVLEASGFPVIAKGILFDPSGTESLSDAQYRISSWTELNEIVVNLM